MVVNVFVVISIVISGCCYFLLFLVFVLFIDFVVVISHCYSQLLMLFSLLFLVVVFVVIFVVISLRFT